MAICRGCGEQSSRTRTTLNQNGSLKEEVCKNCRPDLFDGAVTDPSDKRIWTGPEAMPNQYRLGADGVYHAKDELVADTAALMGEDPDKEAKEWKRANRRTAPMTKDEIANTVAWGEKVMAPAVRGEE